MTRLSNVDATVTSGELNGNVFVNIEAENGKCDIVLKPEEALRVGRSICQSARFVLAKYGRRADDELEAANDRIKELEDKLAAQDDIRRALHEMGTQVLGLSSQLEGVALHARIKAK